MQTPVEGVCNMKAVEREVEVRMGQEMGGMEEVVGGSRDDWAGEGLSVWSNLLKNRFRSFTHV